MSDQPVQKIKHIFRDLAGNEISLKGLKKLYRDVLVHHHGTTEEEVVMQLKHSTRRKKVSVTMLDVDNPLQVHSLFREGAHLLKAGSQSPICRKCELDTYGAEHPYFEYKGPDRPLITIVLDSVSSKEDGRGELGSDGVAAFLAKLIDDMSKDTGVNSTMIRWVPGTRCAKRTFTEKKVDFGSKGNHCKAFLVQDIADHRPSLVMPIGSTALGLLNYKSNAQDWGGKVLTYRGWPDDWLTNPDFARPRPHVLDVEGTGPLVVGHPLFGPPPTWRLPLIPLQSPRIIFGTQNPQVIVRWKNQLRNALKLAMSGIAPKSFVRPWYRISSDPDEIISKLQWLIDHPRTLISFDTETTGLRPWQKDEKIVFMMFRWCDDQGHPQSIGFDWDYPESPLFAHLDRIRPYVLEALYASRTGGHNVTFDMMFVAGTIKDVDLVRLANSISYDTWHMAYTLRQVRGSLSLDILAYDWAPDLAGYDEDFSLLIELYSELLHPDSGGHYARCPQEYRESHLVPYVMGDVEVVHQAREKIDEKLKNSKTYRMPLAHPTERGKFRHFTPQSRYDVYHKTLSPAVGMLIKMMGRGMHVDLKEQAKLEDIYPKLLRETRDKLRNMTPEVVSWCEVKEQSDPDWEFDLESPPVLKDLLFNALKLPVQRLTDAGVAKYGNSPEVLKTIPIDELLKFAKADKYTLNKISVDFPAIRPLQDYRKIFKMYSSYIRPVRNLFIQGFDKKPRDKDQHLAKDGRIHCQFSLTGTRSGRIASFDPNLQQLPRDGDIKRIYTSRFGNAGCMYQGDLSQIELRLIAAACGDETMVNAYRNNVDLHSLTCSRIFNIPYEHFSEEHTMWLQNNGKKDEAKKLKLKRTVAKTCNFLTGYGGGAFGLQATLANAGIYFSVEECENFLESFFDSYPSLRRYLSYYKKFIADHGVAVSILGRVRVFEEVFGQNPEHINKALRAGCNHLIQATASDMMLVCLCVIEEAMRVENLESVLVSTVHDSLVADVKKSELPVVHEIVTDVFNNIPSILQAWYGEEADMSWCIVPFSGDTEVGKNYLDLFHLPKNPDWDEVLKKL